MFVVVGDPAGLIGFGPVYPLDEVDFQRLRDIDLDLSGPNSDEAVAGPGNSIPRMVFWVVPLALFATAAVVIVVLQTRSGPRLRDPYPPLATDATSVVE